jgi:hypothetical protein
MNEAKIITIGRKAFCDIGMRRKTNRIGANIFPVTVKSPCRVTLRSYVSLVHVYSSFGLRPFSACANLLHCPVRPPSDWWLRIWTPSVTSLSRVMSYHINLEALRTEGVANVIENSVPI